MKTLILTQFKQMSFKGYQILTALALFLSFQGFISAQTTVTFNYTGAMQTWVVPPCVYTVTIDVRGAKGAGNNSGSPGNGGLGARVQGSLAVTPGQVLNIYVGGTGGFPAGGWNGGGNGANAGGGCGVIGSGGGGGASDIRIGGTALANRVAVAGGGGGKGGGDPYSSIHGGAAGNPNGNPGTSYFGVAGQGGNAGSGGAAGGPWGGGASGQAGSLGQGGNGAADPCYNYGPGGGGGGGRYGGGGGGSDCYPGCPLGGGAGGGGSSLIPAGGSCTGAYNNGAGLVTITYSGSAPPLVANNTGPYCELATVQFNATAGGASYAWSGPNSYSSAVQNPTIANADTTMNGVYTVVMTMAGGCTSSATTTLFVNPNPNAVAINSGPYCVGDAIQLTSVAGFATDDWAGPGGYTATDVMNPTIPGATVAMSGAYTVTIANGFGCSNTSSTTVVVNALPAAVAGNTGPYCENDVVDITSGGGVDYDWTGPGGFTLANTQNATFPTAAMPMNGVYTVTVTDGNNCVSTATTTMVVNLLPIPVANNDGPYCEGDPIHLTSGGGSNYGWNGPSGYASPVQNPTIAGSTVTNTGTYTVLVTTAQGCTGTTTTDVVVTALPTPVANNTGPYCEGEKIDLSVVGGSSWVWAGPLAFGSIAQNPSINNAIPTNSGTYTVTATDGAGCISQTTTVVLVSPTPTAVPQFAPQNPSMLKPEVDFFESSYANISTYLWDIDGVPYNTSTFTHTFTDPGDFPSYLVVTNIYGCIDTTFFNVHVDPETSIYIPNSFTPNGDDLNEIFFVYGMGWERMEMIIFDRWGSEVFYSTDVTKGWNGMRNNTGDILAEGTYTYKVYIIDLYGKEHNFMGHVNVIR
jgi:gliding motility-associated-like protein